MRIIARRPFLSAGVAAGALLFTVAPSARAQSNPGFAVNQFDPAEKGSDWFVNESLDLRGKLRPAVGILGEVSSNPVPFSYADGSNQGSLVSSQVYAHVGASLVLVDRLRLGVSLPVALYQNGDSITLFQQGGTVLQPPSKGGIGDVRLGADVRLLGEYKSAFTAAVGAQVHVPSGPQSQYLGDGAARIVPRLMVAGDIKEFAYSARIGYEFRGRAEPFAGVEYGDLVTAGVAVGLRGLDRHLLVGPELYGSTLAAHAFHSVSSPGEVLLGVHYTWSDFRFGAGLGTGLTNAFGSPNARAILGFEWSPAIEEPKPSDRDNDGVDDEHDACPDVPGVKSVDPKLNGCPVPVAAPPPPPDKDGDGILDADDACPDVKGVKTDDPKTNGCPPPGDADGDGITDDVDACPDKAGVKTDDPKTNGCPAPPGDKDKDGVTDDVDACPDEPGIKSEDPKKNGCPALAAIQNGQIKITEQVKFKTGSAEILKESDAVLNAVLTVLKDHPEIKMRVEGHTDNKGGAAMNRTLSQKRAASVANWLVLKGLDKGRITKSEGFGPDKPLDTNDTDAGRQNNRRVEFHIEGTPAGAGPQP